MVSAFTTVADCLAGMIAGQPFTVSVAVGAAVMIRVAMAATYTAAMATGISATVSTTMTPSVTATASITTTASIATATATATAIFRIGRAHDGQVNGEQWRSCKHQGAGKDRKETFIL